MPVKLSAAKNVIQTKITYGCEFIVIHLNRTIKYEELCEEIQEIWRFSSHQIFTIKWVDADSDLCTISSQLELDEAIRLNHKELTVHIFGNSPHHRPGMPCLGEIERFRFGVRRWKKLYRLHGHIFETKRLFNRFTNCALCDIRIWGLAQKCKHCQLLVHKKCDETVNNIASCNIGPDTTKTDLAYKNNKISSSEDIFEESRNRSFTMEDLTILEDGETKFSQKHNETNLQEVAELEQSSVLENQREYSLNDFELIRVIGRGSFAKVFIAQLKSTKRSYAMKVIKKSLLTEMDDIEMIHREKDVFEHATNYPFLVKLHSSFQTPSRVFFILELIRGGDLMTYMQQQKRLSEEHAQFYAAEICLAVSFLHFKGIIYRDLKLDNVLLDHEGHIKLTDYGMSKSGIKPGDRTRTFCGTPNYIAPEAIRGEEYGFSVDWWALGVLLYEMLAGRSPFHIAENSDDPDKKTEDFLFQIILDKTIRYPRHFSLKAVHVLRRFLNKDPVFRLGGQTTDSLIEIAAHPFFEGIDWDLLEQKRVSSPYKPLLDSSNESSDDGNLVNFPAEFTDEPVCFTPDDPTVIEKIDQSDFEGFDYVNSFYSSVEYFV